VTRAGAGARAGRQSSSVAVLRTDVGAR
jgi:hypothetical protein